MLTHGVPSGLLRSLVEGTSDAVFVLDRTGRYLLCNAPAGRLVGRPVAAVVGHTARELFGDVVADAAAVIHRRILDTGATETADEVFPTPDGTRTLHITRHPIHAADGTVEGVVVIIRAGAERSRAPAGPATGGGIDAIRRSEGHLRTVLDALPVGVMVVDRKGDLVLGNAASRAIWGESVHRGEDRWTASRGWWRASGAALRPHDWASVRALWEGVPHLDQLIDIEGFGGVRRTIRNSAVPLLQPSGIEGAVILTEDVTERLHLEERLVQAQKMEAVGRLAGGVAHDFNNLLTIILSYADLMAQAMPATDPLRADLDQIARAGASAAALTRQLLSFGRRDAPQPRSVRLEVVLRDVEKMIDHALGPRIRRVSHLAEPASAVWIDPVHLEQIVMNLAVNARDAMPTGGELTITTGVVDRTADATRCTTGGRFAVLSVADTGVGMDDRTRARIFEPFFTTKSRGQGTGLGLATVYGLVRGCGGAIRVDSAPDRGTTFVVEIPLSPDDDVSTPVPGDPAELRGSGTILLVEDSAPVRVAVRSMLERFGYSVVEHDEAGAALVYVGAGGQFDLLLTDVVLGGASGRTLADAVCGLRPETRVLYMSGYPYDEVLRLGSPSPARVLAKPFPAEVLARAVREALGR